MRLLKWTLLAIVLVAFPVMAQNVTNVSGVLARSTVLLTEGRYNACGMRFVGVDVGDQPRFPVFAFDFNVTFARFEDAAFGVILKTEITRLENLKEMQTANGKLVKVAATWLQAEGRDPWKAVKSKVAGENGLSSMSFYPADGLFDYLADVAGGKDSRLLLGAQLASERGTRIYRFTPTLQAEDADAYVACVRSMLQQAEQASPRK